MSTANDAIKKPYLYKNGIFIFDGKPRDERFIMNKIYYSDMHIIKALANTSFDYNKYFSDGYNPMYLLITRGSFKALEYLFINSKIDPNKLTSIKTPNNGVNETPIILLSEITTYNSSNFVPILRLLLEHDADPTIKNSAGKNFFDIFSERSTHKYHLMKWLNTKPGQKFVLNTESKYFTDFLIFFNNNKIDIREDIKSTIPPELLSAIELNLL